MSSEDDKYGYVTDLAQAGTQKLGRTTEEVNALVKHLKEAVASVGKNGRVIHIAHSQGALLTSLAARELTPLEMNQIEVLAFGGAAALRKTVQTPWRRVVNYYSVNDPLLLVVPQAAQALRQGYFVGASGDSGDDFSSEFCFLAPRIGDPIQDHNLLGATYGQALAWEGQRFQSQYQSLVYRVGRTVDLRLTGPLWLNTVTGTLIITSSVQHVIQIVLHYLLAPIVLVLRVLYTLLQEGSRLALKVCGPVILSIAVLLKAVLEDLIRSVNKQEQYQPVHLALDLGEESGKKGKAKLQTQGGGPE
uniref:Uncharacterized protein n=1 Tax=Grammatophora oceanica TaxID=210454 RepID=A0A7S1VP71_9STRA